MPTPSCPPDSASFEPVEAIPGDPGRGLVLLCDHATPTLPPGYGSLGLPSQEFVRHIAYDIGARDLTRRLSARLDAPAILAGFSRLLIDPNRGEDDPTLVMRLSDRTVIPGNARITADERQTRIERFWRPYHARISAALDAALGQGRPPVLLSIHSFTPVWRGRERPWHCAVLWDRDPRLALPLIDALRRDGDLHVGDNEPYDGALRHDTLFRHGTARGLAHALIEVRQDLVSDEAGIAAWTERLGIHLETLLACPDLHEIRHYGSRTGPVP